MPAPETFAPLTEPRPGVHFFIHRLMVYFNWAKTGSWAYLDDAGKERRTVLFSVHTVERYINGRVAKALTIMIGPLKIMMGIA